MRVLSLAVLVGLAQAQTSRVCNAPVDLVFILDESGSVGSVDNEKALLFMEDVLDRFDVGTSANQAHVAMVAFSTTTQIDFPLDRHFTTAAAKAGVQASVYNGGITCTGGAMRLVSDQILCAGCPGRRADTPGKRACARACVCVCVHEERYICACALCLTLTSRFEPSPSRSYRADPDGRKPVKRRELPELR